MDRLSALQVTITPVLWPRELMRNMHLALQSAVLRCESNMPGAALSLDKGQILEGGGIQVRGRVEQRRGGLPVAAQTARSARGIPTLWEKPHRRPHEPAARQVGPAPSAASGGAAVPHKRSAGGERGVVGSSTGRAVQPAGTWRRAGRRRPPPPRTAPPAPRSLPRQRRLPVP